MSKGKVGKNAVELKRKQQEPLKNGRSMSITRALATMKKLKNDISGFRNDAVLSSVYREKNKVKMMISPVDLSPEEAKTLIDKNYRSIIDKFNEYLTIKNAIALANVNTKVNFRGSSYTIFGLIAYRDMVGDEINIYKSLESSYKKSHMAKLQAETKATEERTRRKDELLKANKSISEIDKFMNDGTEEFHIYSPLPINEIIEKISSLEDVKSEIDMLLSEVNASTMIKY